MSKTNNGRGAFERLMADIEQALTDAEGGWEITWAGALRITTKESDRPGLSSNGGEYYYYRRYSPDGLGVFVEDDWSCDFADYGDEGQYYDCVISTEGLARMAQLADVTIAARAWLNKEPGCMKRLKAAIRSLDE